MLKRGSRTPWGSAQFVKDIAEGIQVVNTAGHGGIKLDRKRQSEMPKVLRREGGWYEEDCEWALVAVGLPQHFDAKTIESAHKTVRNWFPEAFEAHFGCVILPGHSTVKDERAFYEAHKNDWIVTCAFGDWKENVPKGMVGVIATQGGLREGSNCPNDPTIVPGPVPERLFLVPETEYDKRSRFGFIIDLNRHKEFDFLVRKAV